MKDQEDIFPGGCYIFDFLHERYCARFEKVRVPSKSELLARWKDKKPIGDDASVLSLVLCAGLQLIAASAL